MSYEEVKCELGTLKYKTKFTLAEKLDFEGRIAAYKFNDSEVGIASLYARIVEVMEPYIDYSGLKVKDKKFKDYKEVQYDESAHDVLIQACSYYYAYLYGDGSKKK